MRAFAFVIVGLTLGLGAYSGGSGMRRPYDAPDAATLLSAIQARQAEATNFLAESRMEYWSGDERIKPTVQVMGERGAKVRFNALNPDNTVAADLACNGGDFKYVDYNNNCQLEGPCNRDSIGQLLRVRLEPDDFLLLAVGGAPLLSDAKASVKWDAEKGQEVLLLATSDGRKQELRLDGRKQNWDVLASTMWDASGAIEWELTNKDFGAKKSDDGKSFRIPERTRFKQPEAKAEVTIRWGERYLNTELTEENFEMELEDEYPRCGKNSASSPPA